MFRFSQPTVTKFNANGDVVYEGPDMSRRWRRPRTDAAGRFAINEEPETYVDGRGELKRTSRPMGAIFAATRPGRLICPGQLETRVW